MIPREHLPEHITYYLYQIDFKRLNHDVYMFIWQKHTYINHMGVLVLTSSHDDYRPTFFFSLHFQSSEDVNNYIQHEELKLECSSNHDVIWLMTIIIYKAFIMVFGVFLTWQTRYTWAMARFLARCLPPYEMSGSFHTL